MDIKTIISNITVNSKLSKPKWATETIAEFLSEAKLKGVSSRPFQKQELINYLDSIITKTKKKKFPKGKFQYPYIHRMNIPFEKNDTKLPHLKGIVSSETGNAYNLVDFYKLITERPKKILKQNEKMQHSDGSSKLFFNIGLPAIKGLVGDEEKGPPNPQSADGGASSFVIVNTCPGAGKCMVVCFATKGGYVQWKGTSLSSTRMVNYLWNDPDKFFAQLDNEIARLVKYHTKRKNQVVIRWHDSGDFFSPDYIDMAFNLANKHPNVLFYAYTKIASIAKGKKPDNFVISFSMGAHPSQEKQIDFSTTKSSVIVPRSLFKGLLEKDEDDKWQYKDQNAIKTIKNNISKEYNVDKNTLVTYDELMKLPWSTEPNKYSVIVKPGDGDVGAARVDVLTSYLLEH